MKIREFRGAVNRARVCYISVCIDSEHEHGTTWCELSKVSARKIADHCARNGIGEINARVDSKRDLFIEETEEGLDESVEAADDEAAECDGCSCPEHDGEVCEDEDCACPAGHDDE